MPIRTCLVTKIKAEPRELLRFVVREGELKFDRSKQKQPGRGGYVVRTPEAIGKLPKLTKKVSHFLRCGACRCEEAELAWAKGQCEEGSELE